MAKNIFEQYVRNDYERIKNEIEEWKKEIEKSLEEKVRNGNEAQIRQAYEDRKELHNAWVNFIRDKASGLKYGWSEEYDLIKPHERNQKNREKYLEMAKWCQENLEDDFFFTAFLFKTNNEKDYHYFMLCWGDQFDFK